MARRAVDLVRSPLPRQRSRRGRLACFWAVGGLTKTGRLPRCAGARRTCGSKRAGRRRRRRASPPQASGRRQAIKSMARGLCVCVPAEAGARHIRPQNWDGRTSLSTLTKPGPACFRPLLTGWRERKGGPAWSRLRIFRQCLGWPGGAQRSCCSTAERLACARGGAAGPPTSDRGGGSGLAGVAHACALLVRLRARPPSEVLRDSEGTRRVILMATPGVRLRKLASIPFHGRSTPTARKTPPAILTFPKLI